MLVYHGKSQRADFFGVQSFETFRRNPVKLKVIVHPAEEGGYWAEVPAIPGCATQGETFEELLKNIYEAVEGCLSVEILPSQLTKDTHVVEIAV